MIIKNVEFGWAHMEFGDFKISASYLTDVALDILEAINNYYKTGQPPSINFDGEAAGEYMIVIDAYETYIIYDDEETGDKKLYVFEMERNKLILDLINGIYDNLSEFLNWFSYRPITEEELNERKKEILNNINEINKRGRRDFYER